MLSPCGTTAFLCYSALRLCLADRDAVNCVPALFLSDSEAVARESPVLAGRAVSCTSGTLFTCQGEASGVTHGSVFPRETGQRASRLQDTPGLCLLTALSAAPGSTPGPRPSDTTSGRPRAACLLVPSAPLLCPHGGAHTGPPGERALAGTGANAGQAPGTDRHTGI